MVGYTTSLLASERKVDGVQTHTQHLNYQPISLFPPVLTHPSPIPSKATIPTRHVVSIRLPTCPESTPRTPESSPTTTTSPCPRHPSSPHPQTRSLPSPAPPAARAQRPPPQAELDSYKDNNADSRLPPQTSGHPETADYPATSAR